MINSDRRMYLNGPAFVAQHELGEGGILYSFNFYIMFICTVNNWILVKQRFYTLQKLQQHLKGLQSDLGDVSRRCLNFFEEKPTSISVPVLRSELNLAVEQIEKLDSLSSIYLHK